jgi:hypothetical protein
MFTRIVIGATLAAAGTAAAIRIGRWWRMWGVVPDEATKPLPGDDVVVDGETLLTRGVTIGGPPEAVWPWLVQMGYEPAGWYSYDLVDMRGRSADAVLPGLQDIRVGDLMPTHPAGGFEVKLLDPRRALVLYLDTALVAQQTTAPDAQPISVGEAPGLAASGRFLQVASPPDFAVSWSFVLEPAADGRTRLIERMRGRFGPDTIGSKAMLPLMGFGVFLMMRKQMLGIRDRVEREQRRLATAHGGPPVPTEIDPVEFARDVAIPKEVPA